MSSRKTSFERRRAAILQLHKQKLGVQEIMRVLNLTETTVRFHLSGTEVQPLERPVQREEPKKQQKKPNPLPDPVRESADLDNPVTFARKTLGSRVTERLGSYWIDGQPVGIDRLIQSANSVLKERGKRQITGKEGWEI